MEYKSKLQYQEKDSNKLTALEKDGRLILVVWECGLKGKANILASVALAERWLISSRKGICQIRYDEQKQAPTITS